MRSVWGQGHASFRDRSDHWFFSFPGSWWPSSHIMAIPFWPLTVGVDSFCPPWCFWVYLDTSGSCSEIKIFNWIVFTKTLLLNMVTFTGPDSRCFWAWGGGTRPFGSLSKRKGSRNSRSLAPATGVWFTCWHGLPCESCPEIKACEFIQKIWPHSLGKDAQRF